MARKEKKQVNSAPGAAPVPSLPEPSEAERKAIVLAREKHAARTPRVQSGMVNRPGGALITNPHSDGYGWEARLQNAFGSCSKEFVNANLNSLSAVLRNVDGTVRVDEVDAVLAVLDGAEPQNEIEAMLVPG